MSRFKCPTARACTEFIFVPTRIAFWAIRYNMDALPVDERPLSEPASPQQTSIHALRDTLLTARAGLLLFFASR